MSKMKDLFIDKLRSGEIKMGINKQEKIRRLKVRLFECMMAVPIDEMSSSDIQLFNLLSIIISKEAHDES